MSLTFLDRYFLAEAGIEIIILSSFMETSALCILLVLLIFPARSILNNGIT